MNMTEVSARPGFCVAKISRCSTLTFGIETGHALMKDNNPIPDTEIPMTSSTRRKLKSLKKKIAERHSEKPEENEIPIEKKDLEKDR
jgi:hypothetical protein